MFVLKSNNDCLANKMCNQKKNIEHMIHMII